MDHKTYEWHLQKGKEAGIDKTCGKKIAFDTEEKGIKAANHHNNWDGRNHDVETYPCYFCNKWHIGRIMKND